MVLQNVSTLSPPLYHNCTFSCITLGSGLFSKLPNQKSKTSRGPEDIPKKCSFYICIKLVPFCSLVSHIALLASGTAKFSQVTSLAVCAMKVNLFIVQLATYNLLTWLFDWLLRGCKQ